MPEARESKKSAAVREALLDAAIAEAMDTESEEGEKIIERIVGDDATTESFVLDSRNADTIEVYNQYDGTRSNILLSMLSKQLRKRFPRDPSIPMTRKLAFKIVPPRGMKPQPKFKCMFHAESPIREELASMGLGARLCSKDNMPSEMDAQMHARRKHPQEFNLYERTTQRRREDEDRELRRQEVEAMKQLAANRGSQ
ncbi:MAG: hypothetical protein LC118_05880 [Dehalococcoidia bacterium]|nr:hypothetical protein [Dehalococcoidia bacterium]